MKYIDAEKLIAVLERQNVDKKVIEPLIRIITSFQQEQPEQDITEFEKALDDFGEAYATLVDRDNNPNQGIRINAYHELVQERINEILSLAKEYVKQEQPDNEDIDKVAQELYEHLYELKRRNNVPTNLYDKQEIIDLWKAGIEYAYNHPKQEQPEVDLEKFTDKIKTFQERYKYPEVVSIKGAMAFMARMFYQYPNVARQWYDNLSKATMD